jgi:RNA polymerase sigma factor (sigma-70 family)
MDPAEAENIERARRGDRPAFDALFCRHADALLAHARHRIDPRWRAHLTPDDVLQTTCIDALRHIAAFTPRGDNSFLQWLKQIAEHNIIDVVRALEAEERRRPPTPTVRFGRTIDPSVSLVQSLVAAETASGASRALTVEDARRTLREGLDQLPADHRRIVEWYDLEGRSIASIAEQIGKTPGAAYMMRTRAHQRLREVLAKKAASIFTNP